MAADRDDFTLSLMAWSAGVVSYSVDFEKRFVVYSGVNGESYQEDYPAVEVFAKAKKGIITSESAF